MWHYASFICVRECHCTLCVFDIWPNSRLFADYSQHLFWHTRRTRWDGCIQAEHGLIHFSNMSINLFKRNTQIELQPQSEPGLRSFSPSVLRPGLEVKLATSTIFTANCWPVSLLIQRLTTLKGPLQHTHTSWVSHRRRQKTHTQIWNMIFLRKRPRFSWHTHTYTLSALGRHRAIFENRHHSLYTRANGNYRVVACSTAVKAKIKALL